MDDGLHLEGQQARGRGGTTGHPDPSGGSAREDPRREGGDLECAPHPRDDGHRRLRRGPVDAGARAHLGPRLPPARRRRATTSSRGQPLATVASPDFAAAVSAYRKAEAAARNARRIADLDEQLFKNDALARRDLDQARDRRDRRRGRPRRRAPAAARRSASTRRPSTTIRRGPAGPRRGGRDPLADRRHGRGEADHARPAAAGRHHAVLHRRRPLHGVGHGQRLRVRPAVRRGRRSGGRHDRRRGRRRSRDGRLHRGPRRSRTRAPSRCASSAANPRRVLKRDMYVRVAIHSRSDSTGLLVAGLGGAARRREPAVRLRRRTPTARSRAAA